ncbi:hypothetical protein POM88_051284 [Heracleum sosnowskyi]|uniref:Uncharacterized protein n=1 Tax=Heracleum sosnowskyi TaxID=360622 RepID=A0AAD8H0B3_9APIA|nr:hypothetical protein POM88_051284 [Heracleum sosnowskyi]
MALLNRWNKVSKAIRRRREYPYVFSLYADHGPFDSEIVIESSAGCQVSLINDNDKTKGEKFRRRIHKWNGPLGNRQRKVEEEFIKKWFLEEEQRRLKMDDKSSETMHGFWFGSVDTFKYEVTSVKCLRRPSQMIRDNRYLESETPPLKALKVVLQFRKPLASVRLVIKSIWNDAGILSFSRGNVIDIDRFTPVSTIKFYAYKMMNELIVNANRVSKDHSEDIWNKHDVGESGIGLILLVEQAQSITMGLLVTDATEDAK